MFAIRSKYSEKARLNTLLVADVNRRTQKGALIRHLKVIAMWPYLDYKN